MLPATIEFKASYDRTTKLISVGVCGLLLLIAVLIQNVFVVCLSLLLAGLAYAWSPQGYRVSARSIVVRRLIGNPRFPLDGVREAKRATGDDLRGCIRLFGSGGFFGYYGLFRTSRLGTCRWYVTNRANTVVVVGPGKTALFSPDDVDGFLAAIRQQAPVPQASVWDWTRTFGSQNRGISTGTWAGAAVGVAAVGLVVAAVSYSPGRPRCTLSADALAIHDRFYPVTVKASAVDVSGVRVVDITADRDWRPTMRTNGFANAHYRSGWFRVANGQKVRLYRADSTRLVLLPPRGNGAPILLEVRQPQTFVEQIRLEWGQHP